MFTDAEQCVREWANADPTLTGAGNPLTNGLHLSVRDSPAHGTYGVVTRAGGGDDPGSGAYDTPRISVSVWGPTKQAAMRAAVALADALTGLARQPVTVASGRVMYAGNVTLLWSPDGARSRYIVDADVGVTSA